MRVIINTTLALSGSCICSFAVSCFYGHGHGRFEMEDILNATLAGGVIVGSTSDMMTLSWVVIALGSVGGMISVVGYHSISKCMPFHDTCGVHNLHGIPGVLGGLTGAILAWALDDDGFEAVFGTLAEGRTHTT